MKKSKKLDFKPIIKYIKPHKKDAWMASVFVVLENSTYLILPLIYSQIIDIVTKGTFFDWKVYGFLVAWALIQLSGAVFLRFKQIWVNRLGNKVSFDLMNGSIAHLVRLPMSFHKQKKIGEIIQRFSRADQYLYNMMDQALFGVIPSLISSFLAFGIILWVNWGLALIYLVFILIYFVITIRGTNPIIKFQRKLNKLFEGYYGNIFDRTPNIISIKSNTRERFENEKNESYIDKFVIVSERQMVMWMNVYFIQSVVKTFSFITLFGLGIFLVSRGEASIGQFVMLLSYINMLADSIDRLGGNYKRLQEGLTTINKSERIFKETTEEYETDNPVKIEYPKGDIVFENVSFSYEDEKVLEDISFKVKAGQMVAIVGKSGEGKSTLVDLISRYNIPQQGKILFDGIDIARLNLEDLRKNIAIVPQEINLFNDSIKNNIAYANLEASEEEIIQAAKLANCHHFIDKFPKKYEQIVGEKGVKLSTGQKQRVAIARAILRNPRILILDEATSALDSESEKYVQSALEEVMKDRTTFVIAHRLSTIRKADLILVIENGRIVESGDHKELMNHGGVYKKLSELQNIQV